jgi:hypothetical protein
MQEKDLSQKDLPPALPCSLASQHCKTFPVAGSRFLHLVRHSIQVRSFCVQGRSTVKATLDTPLGTPLLSPWRQSRRSHGARGASLWREQHILSPSAPLKMRLFQTINADANSCHSVFFEEGWLARPVSQCSGQQIEVNIFLQPGGLGTQGRDSLCS